MRRPSREQEVLHYQWFADLGSVEAQRAVGQIFSHGAMRNPEQALRYFRCSQHHLSYLCRLPYCGVVSSLLVKPIEVS